LAALPASFPLPSRVARTPNRKVLPNQQHISPHPTAVGVQPTDAALQHSKETAAVSAALTTDNKATSQRQRGEHGNATTQHASKQRHGN